MKNTEVMRPDWFTTFCGVISSEQGGAAARYARELARAAMEGNVAGFDALYGAGLDAQDWSADHCARVANHLAAILDSWRFDAIMRRCPRRSALRLSMANLASQLAERQDALCDAGSPQSVPGVREKMDLHPGKSRQPYAALESPRTWNRGEPSFVGDRRV